jgi:hypothetical protein
MSTREVLVIVSMPN